MLAQEFLKVGAADLLFPFDQENHVHGQGTLFTERLRHAEDVREDLALVVGSTARVDASLRDTGLERRGGPAVERVGGLDVIVAVDQDGALGRIRRCPRQHHRRSLRRVNGGRQVGRGEKFAQPLGAGEEVWCVFRLGRDTGEAEKLPQKVDRILGRMRRVHE